MAAIFTAALLLRSTEALLIVKLIPPEIDTIGDMDLKKLALEKVIIGGNPVSKEACVHIGSYAYTIMLKE